MKIIVSSLIILTLVAMIACAPEAHSLKNQDQHSYSNSSYQNYFAPKTFFIDSNLLAQAKKIFQSNESKSPFGQEVTRLIQEAETYLKSKPTSVMDKDEVPPSGNKHDFLSLTPYRWPNPNTQSGLPYIFRDGKTNPEVYKIP